MSIKKQYQIFGLAAVLFILIMSFGTAFDLEISHTVMDQKSWFGAIFQMIGILPMYLVLMVSGEIGLAYAWRVSNNRLFSGSLVVGSGALTLWQIQKGLKELLSYGGAIIHNIKSGQPIGVANSDVQASPFSPGLTFTLTAIVFVIFTTLTQRWLKQRSIQQLEALLLLAIFATVTVLMAMSVNGALKNAWGRARPYEIIHNGARFTNWYTMNGANGHKSFPSGHAMAAALTVVLAWFANGNWRRFWWFGGIGITVIVDLSRVRVGAHFLTDVTFSTCLTFMIIYVMWEIYQHIKSMKR